ncbi:hypothetical protein THAOC_11236 [Thalassiosira oceanica]|uniref:Uncharacterized protein n=1 Tax=Thalassiosira oceanica TaxID=159749 RepID=K0SRZ0_THAOC|nr:hypothetical protein THAOC_11236 [Thalassiosira oceanica]|eukprot:EJK67699.1 hypothetical protein THAOC_11236 [Thalassiosira oceanica]
MMSDRIWPPGESSEWGETRNNSDTSTEYMDDVGLKYGRRGRDQALLRRSPGVALASGQMPGSRIIAPVTQSTRSRTKTRFALIAPNIARRMSGQSKFANLFTPPHPTPGLASKSSDRGAPSSAGPKMSKWAAAAAGPAQNYRTSTRRDRPTNRHYSARDRSLDTFQSSIDILKTFVVHLFKGRSKLSRGKVPVFNGHSRRRRHDGGAALDEFVDIGEI